MELNINSPAYYSQEYWVDDEIYWMCRQLAAAVRENKYSDIINVIVVFDTMKFYKGNYLE